MRNDQRIRLAVWYTGVYSINCIFKWTTHVMEPFVCDTLSSDWYQLAVSKRKSYLVAAFLYFILYDYIDLIYNDTTYFLMDESLLV